MGAKAVPKFLSYTTTIEAETSASEVQRLLASHGARHVMVSYDRGEPVGLTFLIAESGGERAYRLSAHVARVERVLSSDARAGRVPRRLATREQAARVAWRLIKVTVEVQLSWVRAGLATLDELMLPHRLVAGDQTVHEAMQGARAGLPPP